MSIKQITLSLVFVFVQNCTALFLVVGIPASLYERRIGDVHCSSNLSHALIVNVFTRVVRSVVVVNVYSALNWFARRSDWRERVEAVDDGCDFARMFLNGGGVFFLDVFARVWSWYPVLLFVVKV